MRLKLYAQIGAVLRSGRRQAASVEAFSLAKSYTDDPVILTHLNRNIADMTEADGDGADRL